ncbi:ligand-binding sensor domain-containing protein [Pleionea litopenaei]|uniref:Two-component regulator propeller domain-containing protein n=1 Tax=Pleionea litopenaei TaxID=3070815 RepID=A0AA51RU49_9GAMM|nr:two-component regulator propeller domain-containing protein [Pleionea sp. HL-JVS1]WMS87708.1 two-component regulator propeller domain-containing protein [Pleionea sp. HL-JVS1]
MRNQLTLKHNNLVFNHLRKAFLAFLFVTAVIQLRADSTHNLVTLSPQLHLSHYAIEDGLSLNTVTAFAKTQDGYMWIGTEDGLNRFDGYTFQIFKRTVGKENTLPDNMISALLADSQGRLWVGTEKGLAIWSGGTDFKNVQTMDGSLGRVSVIEEDIYNRIWVVVKQQLMMFNDSTQKLEPYHEMLSVKTHQVNTAIESLHSVGPLVYFGKKNCLNSIDIANLELKEQCFTEDNIGRKITRITTIYSNGKDLIWIGTSEGLIRYSTLSGSAELFHTSAATNRRLSGNHIQSLLVDNENKVWIATATGLNVFDPLADRVYQYHKNYIDQRGLLSDDIVSIFQDDVGLVWLGTYGSGLNVFNRQTQNFNHYFTKRDAFNLNSSNTIHSITTDLLGNIWVGSYGSGLFQIDSQRKTLRRVTDHTGSLKNSFITSLHFDIYDNLWISTLSGLYVYDPDYQSYHQISHPKFKGIVSTISEDRNGDLWIGVDSGLVKIEGVQGKYDETANIRVIDFTHRIKKYLDDKNYIINDIYEDVEGLLWIGSDLGLFVVEPSTEFQHAFVHDENNTKSLSHNYVQVIYEDTQGVIWIGTGDGLNKLVMNNGLTQNAYFEHFSEDNGLVNDSVYGILSGEGDELWLSTSNGLVRFYTSTNKVEHFTTRDGLQSNEFNLWAYHKSSDNEIFFGGINGITSFYPDSIIVEKRDFIPSVSSIKINNQAIRSFDSFEKIVLSKKSDLVSISLTPLDFSNPSSHQFRYRLKGFNDEWIEIGSTRVINISGLVGDGATLEIQTKVTGNDWNSPIKDIAIEVNTNFWQSEKGVMFYIVLSLVLVSAMFTLWSRRLINRGRLVRSELNANREYIRNIQLDIEREKSATDLANQELVQLRERIAYYESRFDEYAKKDRITRFYKRKFFEEIINNEDAFYKSNQLDFPAGCLITIAIKNYSELLEKEHKANVEAAVADFSDIIKDYVSGDDLICRWNSECFLMLESGSIHDIKQRLYNFHRLISNRTYDCGNGRLLPFEFILTVIPVPVTSHRSSLINRSVIAYLSIDLIESLKPRGEQGAFVFKCRSQMHPAEIEKKISYGADLLMNEAIFELVPLNELLIKENV